MPADCPTFLTKKFFADGFKPSTNLGHFDAEYDVKAGLMTVTVRADLEFVDTANRKWDPKDEADFKKGFPLVADAWDKKFTIKCTKKGFEKVPPVKVVFELQASNKDPHYKVKVMPTTGTANTAVRPDGTAKFGMQATDRLANAATQLKQIKEDLGLPFYVPIGQTGGAQFSFASLTACDAYATACCLAFGKKASSVKVKLLAWGGKDQKEDKANAEKVKMILESCGFKAKWTIEAGNQPTEPDGAPPKGVLVETDKKDIDAHFPKDPAAVLDLSQATIAHEFGHMLGLPDEYNALCSESVDSMIAFGMMGTGGKLTPEGQARLKDLGAAAKNAAKTDAITKNQKAFVELCSKANIPAPPFGKANASIMSAGSKFGPHHGVTVWECLCSLTKDFVSPAEWDLRLGA